MEVYVMKAFAQFMLSIGSMGSLDTGTLTQILLLGSNEDDEDFEPEASELAQELELQFCQKLQETSQRFDIKVGIWTIAIELENEDGGLTYQFVRL